MTSHRTRALSSSVGAGERVFHFVSDPDYRENLSGRVRAACVTCRRKKIKCSGEPVCTTCREKGIVCEGFQERKKPRRSVDASPENERAGSKPHNSSSPCGNRSLLMCNAAASTRRAARIDRPPVASVAQSSASSIDSGYITSNASPIMAGSRSTASFDHRRRNDLVATNIRSNPPWIASDAAGIFQASGTAPMGQFVDMSMPGQQMGASSTAYSWTDAHGQTWWFDPCEDVSSLTTFADPLCTTTMAEAHALSQRCLTSPQTMQGVNGVFPRTSPAQHAFVNAAMRATMAGMHQSTAAVDSGMWPASRSSHLTDDAVGDQCGAWQTAFDSTGGMGLPFGASAAHTCGGGDFTSGRRA